MLDHKLSLLDHYETRFQWIHSLVKIDLFPVSESFGVNFIAYKVKVFEYLNQKEPLYMMQFFLC
jgi:hypothetical protein